MIYIYIKEPVDLFELFFFFLPVKLVLYGAMKRWLHEMGVKEHVVFFLVLKPVIILPYT